MNEELIVYSLSVSGGCFTSQIALLGELYRAKKMMKGGKFTSSKDYAPDICLCSSGGNITAYVGLASDWEPIAMMRLARSFKPEMFIKSWFPDYMSFLPTAILGVFNGSLYRPGYGSKYVFNKYFSPKTIQNTEIWTGTINMTLNKAEFFCNKSRSNAYIKQCFFEADCDVYGALPLRYMADEPDMMCKIAKVTMASASIPYLVKNQQVDNCMYADGGTMYASPTVPLAGEIYRIVRGKIYDEELCMDKNGNVSSQRDIDKPKRLRHFYFSPYDTYSTEITVASRTIITPIAQILHSNLLQDKAAAISTLLKIYNIESSQLTHEHYIDVESDTLCKVLLKLEQYDHYICDLYPKGLSKVPLHKFTSTQIEDRITYAQCNYAIQVWYYSPKS